MNTLTRDEVRSLIKGKPKLSRLPLLIHFWVHPDSFGERRKEIEGILASYPQDIQISSIVSPSRFRNVLKDHPDYSWLPYPAPMDFSSLAHDEQVAMPTWDRLDETLENLLDLDVPFLFNEFPPPDSRYRIAHWWFCLFERHWWLRGMVNALTDYYEYPEQVHKLFAAFTKLYCRRIERAAKEQKCDGIWTSDDLGTQTGPFFSREIFREFFKPYYAQMADAAHRNGMEFWMHACGCIDLHLQDWIDAGVDVIHPIQKHTMDEKKVVSTFGNQVCFLAGLDVQQVLPWGKPDDVRREVRWMLDTFLNPERGGLIISAGNGINEDCPTENLKAFFEESVSYGTKVCERWR